MISNVLNNWLTGLFTNFDINITSNDASNRQYFRLTYPTHHNYNHSYIVMDSSKELSSLKQFVLVHNLLNNHQIYVPKIHHQSLELGFLVLEDLGDKTFWQALDKKNTLSAYQNAIDDLLKLQQIPSQSLNELSEYDAPILKREIQLFPDWYLDKYHKISLNNTQLTALNTEFEYLIDHIIIQPKVLVHRDYHSRNIMCTPDDKLAIIDFQDAIIGAYTYDICSLLKDAYYQLNPNELSQLLNYYQSQYDLSINGVPTNTQQFEFDFDMSAIQRQLKVLGIFARLSIHNNKHQYLTNLPLVAQYLLDTLKKYPQLATIRQLLGQCQP